MKQTSVDLKINLVQWVCFHLIKKKSYAKDFRDDRGCLNCYIGKFVACQEKEENIVVALTVEEADEKIFWHASPSIRPIFVRSTLSVKNQIRHRSNCTSAVCWHFKTPPPPPLSHFLFEYQYSLVLSVTNRLPTYSPCLRRTIRTLPDLKLNILDNGF